MAQENVIVDHQNGAENGSSEAVSFISLKPQLCIPAPKAADAIQFYKAAFGAEEVKRAIHPKRKADQELPLILGAELKLASSVFIVCDQTENTPAIGGFSLRLETDDVEGAISKAVKAGAVADADVAEEEGGCCAALSGKLKDPFGNTWTICSPTKPCVPEAEA